MKKHFFESFPNVRPPTPLPFFRTPCSEKKIWFLLHFRGEWDDPHPPEILKFTKITLFFWGPSLLKLPFFRYDKLFVDNKLYIWSEAQGRVVEQVFVFV